MNGELKNRFFLRKSVSKSSPKSLSLEPLVCVPMEDTLPSREPEKFAETEKRLKAHKENRRKGESTFRKREKEGDEEGEGEGEGEGH